MSLAMQEQLDTAAVRLQVGTAVAPEVVAHHLMGLLSRRELEVAQLALSGLPSREVARRLYVTVNTVKTHIRHILRKTGTSSRSDLIRRLRDAEERRRSIRTGRSGTVAGRPEVAKRVLERDRVTGLPTQSAFRQRAAELLGTTPAPGLAVVWLEVEGRDFLATADRVAADVAVAQALARTAPMPDLAFRWSESQFLALLPAADRDAARDATMRLALSLGQWASVSGFDLLFSLASASSAEGIASPDELVAAAMRRIPVALRDTA
ncbi:DNA-binding CsgD family transcriptional regulator [Symbiobacterium terraclitae]|uniref:DNA-binding CsgD family transcriptional regulator n=1 Tax=Symbiobacterium terraclitae TaxID=557451 RepID=A0ABS4JNT8_9FIRM|nr:DNA-binding CsgD family transcriptional regulator [Symbiobacterium terraclitae]